MDPLLITLIVLGIVIGLPVVFGSLMAITGMILRHRTKIRQMGTEEETRLLQDLHRSIEKLEKRLDSLETLAYPEKQTTRNDKSSA